jgi:hypothetical protein
MNDSAEVADAIRPHFRGYQLNGITFEILSDKIRKVDEWWRVPVQPSRWPDRLFPVYETLAIIEEKLQDEYGLNVVFSLGEPVNTDQPEVVPA